MHRVVEARFKEPVADPRKPGKEALVLMEGPELEMWKDGDFLFMRVPGDDSTTWEVHLSNVRCHRIHQAECPLPPSQKGVEPPPPTKPSSPKVPAAKRQRSRQAA